MKNKLLQPLLKAGLLDIGDSDERLANIEQAIDDLSAILKGELKLLPTYTLVALDPEIPKDDPIIVRVEDVIAERWKALRAKFSEPPVQIIRSVILNTLYNLGAEEVGIARIIYLSASNFYPYARLGHEKDIIEGMIMEFGDAAEKDALDDWALSDTSSTVKVGTLKVSGLNFKVNNLTHDMLVSPLTTAAGRPPQGYNPYNHPNEWAAHFANNAAPGIANFVNEAMSQVGKGFSATELETSINKFFSEFKTSLDASLKASHKSLLAVERRSSLLWWKETLYSSSLKNSYRSIGHSLQPLVMADDLFHQLPRIAPVSVDYLLQDTLLLLNPNANASSTFAEFLEGLKKEKGFGLLKDYFDETNPTGRQSFKTFLGAFAFGHVEIEALKKKTGIDDTATVTLNQIAVMLMRDLSAEYLSQN